MSTGDKRSRKIRKIKVDVEPLAASLVGATVVIMVYFLNVIFFILLFFYFSFSFSACPRIVHDYYSVSHESFVAISGCC